MNAQHFNCPVCERIFSSDQTISLATSYKCPYCDKLVVPDQVDSHRKLQLDVDGEGNPNSELTILNAVSSPSFVKESHILSKITFGIFLLFWGSVVAMESVGFFGLIIHSFVTIPSLLFIPFTVHRAC